jgi:thiol-disulfide isomerase/thioredoxin
VSSGWSQRSASANPAPIFPAQTGAAVSQQKAENDSTQTNVNHFLEYYTRQGTPMPKESASFYFSDGKKLVKKSINSGSLHKTVIMFFGDWCPHCDTFLKNFANDVDILKSHGVTMVFVAVPSIDKLKNWKDPSVEDFKAAEDKISSYGIKLDKEKVFVVMIGDKSVLPSCGVDGLPVLVAVAHGKERFRSVGEKAVHVMNLSDQETLRQFLEIWGKDKTETMDDTPKKETTQPITVDDKRSAQGEKPVKKSKLSGKKAQKHEWGQHYRSRTHWKIPGKVDRKTANEFTKELNNFDYSSLKESGLIFYQE